MNTCKYFFNIKNIIGSTFSSGSKISFRQVSAKMVVMAFCLSTFYVQAQDVTINAGSTETIPGTKSSPWTINGRLYDNGNLNINSGGKVSNTTGYVGNGSGSTGSVTVDGTGSVWNNSGSLEIGVDGSGKLSIRNRASVSNTASFIGFNKNGTGSVSVDGTGSAWNNSGNLVVGHHGKGTLAIRNGAIVSNATGYVGGSLGSTGSVTVDGAGSAWNNSGLLSIGNHGKGTLTISNGAIVSSARGYVSDGTLANGSVTVDGAGSAWNNSGLLSVANHGKGTLAIRNGAIVSSARGSIGDCDCATGKVTMDGAGSAWNNGGDLLVGREGKGTLIISDNGVVNSTGNVTIASDAKSTGTLNVTSEGALETLALVAGSGKIAATFDSGTLRALADNPAFIKNFAPETLIMATGGMTIDDNGHAIGVDGSVFGGPGGLTKTGAGTLTLSGTSTYSGPTTVASGTLKASAADVFSAVSAFTVNSGGTLDMDGYNQTIAQLTNSGIVRISSPTSANRADPILNVSGNYESNGGSLYLSTALGDDQSPTDKLVANSVTTGSGGATRMYVINAGGTGAYTTADGIQVVQVATTSDSNAFVLGHPVTAGKYEYVLDQGKNQSWYLTNVQDEETPGGGGETPGGGGETPGGGGETPVLGEMLYNPNIGSYLGNQYAAVIMFNQNILDRRNSVRDPDQTLWVRTRYNSAESDILGDKQEVRIKTGLIQVGADLIKDNDIIAGVYAGYGHSNTDNKSRQTGTRADGEVNGYHIGVYSSWLPEQDKGPYVDLWAYYAWYDNKLSGSAQPFGDAEYDSTGYALSGEVGYGFELSRQDDGSAWILEPHLQLTYFNIDADDFMDGNGTRYSHNQGSGYQTRAGARLYGQHASGQNGVNPFVELNWLHNSVDNGISMNDVAIASDIGKNVGEVKVGLQGHIKKNLSVWGHIGAQIGSEGFERHEVQVGLGWRW